MIALLRSRMIALLRLPLAQFNSSTDFHLATVAFPSFRLLLLPVLSLFTLLLSLCSVVASASHLLLPSLRSSVDFPSRYRLSASPSVALLPSLCSVVASASFLLLPSLRSFVDFPSRYYWNGEIRVFLVELSASPEADPISHITKRDAAL
jgi:hypothetical protein